MIWRIMSIPESAEYGRDDDGDRLLRKKGVLNHREIRRCRSSQMVLHRGRTVMRYRFILIKSGHLGQASAIGQKIAQYGSKPAQLMVDNKIFVSSFAGDGLNVDALRSAAGRPIFFAPNFHPSYGTNISPVDGLLNWMAWPNNGANKAPTSGANVSVADGDKVYINALGNKAYIARELTFSFVMNFLDSTSF